MMNSHKIVGRIKESEMNTLEAKLVFSALMRLSGWKKGHEKKTGPQ